MKTRNGFVSNSSSSSFIIAIKDFNLDKEKYPSIFIKNVFSKLSDIINDGERISTINELNKRMLEDYCLDSLEDMNEYETKRYSEYKKFIDKGYEIVDINVDYDEHSSILLNCLSKCDDESNIILIDSED